jgi:uncharacterized phage protein gp47/JayE
MPFKRDSLGVILDRIYSKYISLYKPLDKTPRYNLLKVLSAVDAGIYHELLGDLDFLSNQLFPDTATGAYLREHWSSRTPPLYAIGAQGDIIISGIANRSVPAGVVFKSASGETYYTDSAYSLGADGNTLAYVKAQNTGIKTNLAAGEELTIISTIPSGINSKAIVVEGGIIGGANAESDEEYLMRVLMQLQNPIRYGKKDDFAAWAIDASPEVSAAWEFKNFGMFGALLIQVINGNQIDGVSPVSNLNEVRSYINEVAPPILFDVRTPQIINLNPAVLLPVQENTQYNRELASKRLKTYLQLKAIPGQDITAGALRLAIIDGVDITNVIVKLNDDPTGIISITILQYPYIGEIIWE